MESETEIGRLLRAADGTSLEDVRRRHVAIIEEQIALIRELEAQHAEQVATIAGLQAQRDLAVKQANERSEDLEKRLDRAEANLTEDLRRKREECVRLEDAMIGLRDEKRALEYRTNLQQSEVGRLQEENARLRRELGKKNQ